VRKVWDAQLSGQDNGFKLWTVLMFQTWLEKAPETGRSEQVASSPAMLAARCSA
jgi:hypothetical protein